MPVDIPAESEEFERVEAVSDLVLIAGRLSPKTVIIPGGDREDDLRLVESARDHGIVDRCILVGNGDIIRRAAGEVGISITDEDVIATQSQEETADRTIDIVKSGEADIILKGNISTPILNRRMMRIVVRNTISLVTVFDAAPVAGGRPMLLTDPGVTTVCNFGRMVGLIENAIDVARSIMGIDRPRVAVLSANEKVIPSLPSTQMGKALTEREWPDAVVYGPLSFDLAVSEESIRLKGMSDGDPAYQVAGKADILVCPGIDAANVLYKMIMETVKYGIGTFAGVTVGVKAPYVILSRADNVETKLQSIALCSIAAERMEPAKVMTNTKTGSPTRRRTIVISSRADGVRTALFENDKRKQQCRLSDTTVPAADIAEELAAAGDLACDAVVVDTMLPALLRDGLAPGTYILAENEGGEMTVDRRLLEAASESGQGAGSGLDTAIALAGHLGVPAFLWVPDTTDLPDCECDPADLIVALTAADVTARKHGLEFQQANYVIACLNEKATVVAVRGGSIEDCDSFSLQQTEVGRGLIRRLIDGDSEELDRPMVDGPADPGSHDEAAADALEAIAYQIAKSAGAMYVAAGPRAEAIVIAGDLADCGHLTRSLKKRLGHLLPVFINRRVSRLSVPALNVRPEGARRFTAGR